MDPLSTDNVLLAAAAEYSGRRAWVEGTQRAAEFLTIINESFDVLFANHTLPGIADMLVPFMTGFDNGLLENERGASVLRKPFAPQALASALETLIG